MIHIGGAGLYISKQKCISAGAWALRWMTSGRVWEGLHKSSLRSTRHSRSELGGYYWENGTDSLIENR